MYEYLVMIQDITVTVEEYRPTMTTVLQRRISMDNNNWAVSDEHLDASYNRMDNATSGARPARGRRGRRLRAFTLPRPPVFERVIRIDIQLAVYVHHSEVRGSVISSATAVDRRVPSSIIQNAC